MVIVPSEEILLSHDGGLGGRGRGGGVGGDGGVSCSVAVRLAATPELTRVLRTLPLHSSHTITVQARPARPQQQTSTSTTSTTTSTTSTTIATTTTTTTHCEALLIVWSGVEI